MEGNELLTPINVYFFLVFFVRDYKGLEYANENYGKY